MAWYEPLKERRSTLKLGRISCFTLILECFIVQYASICPVHQQPPSVVRLNDLKPKRKTSESGFPGAQIDLQVQGRFKKQLPGFFVSTGIPLSEHVSFQLQYDLTQLCQTPRFDRGLDLGFGYRRLFEGHALLGASIFRSWKNFPMKNEKLDAIGVSFDGVLPNKARLSMVWEDDALADLLRPFHAPHKNRFKIEVSGRMFRWLPCLHNILIDLDLHAVAFTTSSSVDCEKTLLGGQMDTGIQLLGVRVMVGGQCDLRQVWRSSTAWQQALGFRVIFSRHKPLIHRLNRPAEWEQAKCATFLGLAQGGHPQVEVNGKAEEARLIARLEKCQQAQQQMMVGRAPQQSTQDEQEKAWDISGWSELQQNDSPWMALGAWQGRDGSVPSTGCRVYQMATASSVDSEVEDDEAIDSTELLSPASRAALSASDALSNEHETAGEQQLKQAKQACPALVIMVEGLKQIIERLETNTSVICATLDRRVEEPEAAGEQNAHRCADRKPLIIGLDTLKLEDPTSLGEGGLYTSRTAASTNYRIGSTSSESSQEAEDDYELSCFGRFAVSTVETMEPIEIVSDTTHDRCGPVD